jgi:hypothetical protein
MRFGFGSATARRELPGTGGGEFRHAVPDLLYRKTGIQASVGCGGASVTPEPKDPEPKK